MKHLVIIDGLSFFFRAYHAVRPLTRADGLHTNALFGFAQMLIKVVKTLEPDECVVALDSIGNTFRNDIYSEYKANRKELDQEMKEQLPYFEPLINSFGVAGIRVEGFEADDIIATLVNIYKHDKKITIVSSDKDLMQLLKNPNTVMLDTMKNKTIDASGVVEKFGVGPEKVIEVQSLIGDSSDNIPGVKSVGPKTAAELIEQFGTLEEIYNNIEEVKREKLREKLLENKENAFLSKQLVTLKSDVELNLEKHDISFHPDLSKAKDFLLELDFFKLAERLVADGKRQHIDNVEANASAAHFHGYVNSDIHPAFNTPKVIYETVDDEQKLQNWLQKIEQKKVFAIDTETTSLNVQDAEIVGISISIEEYKACYIPLAHKGDMLGGVKQIAKNMVIEALKPYLESNKYTKIGQNIKYDMHIFAKEGIILNNIEDTMLMSAALDAGKHRHNMDNLAKLHLNHTCIAFKDVCGTGKKQITFDEVDIESATKYAAEDADITLRLYNIFKNRLANPNNQSVAKLYNTVEKPLVPTLMHMEDDGILIDRNFMEKLSIEFGERLKEHEKHIYKLAGMEFNIASPKQMGEVLFDHMNLETKGKKRSTDVNVLETLAEQGHEIAVEILQYRSLAKLISTYTEALIAQINPKTGRIHTSYNQVGAATGRFSSSDPNLQNIPIRSEDGRKIRHAFIAGKGNVFLGCDYSQIELRLLAHTSNSQPLIDAFKHGKDIHRHTAAQIFNVSEENVTSEQRSASKAINFGIVYGMGAQALARQINVSKDEASAYIDAYFKRYTGIKEFMEAQKGFAMENGYVETMFGRRINLPDIHSTHGGLRAGAERAAINAPLQGANADIIKMVMPKIEKALIDAGLGAKMLLQVHDELVFEVPENEVDETKKLITNLMETVVELKVPLKVGSAVGKNWEDAH